MKINKTSQKQNRGFTLLEMLIVVAIITILISIAIPTFNEQVEKAKEAKDLATIRNAYAEVLTASIVGDESATPIVDFNPARHDLLQCVAPANGPVQYGYYVSATQSKAGWVGSANNVAGIEVGDAYVGGEKDGWFVSYIAGDASVIIEAVELE